MRVLVATRNQVRQAFAAWIAEADTPQEARRRRSLERVFEAFMGSEEGRALIAPTALYSCTLEQWQQALDDWRDREILRLPSKQAAIRDWTAQLAALLMSAWPIRYKLLVRECLTDEDLPRHETAA